MPNTIGYFGKRGELRLYSGSSNGLGGQYYFQVAFEQGDLTFPGGRARPDELPVLDRGLYTSFAHMLQGPDVPIIQPVQVTFTAQIESTVNRLNLYRALCNPGRDNPWTVGGVTWSNVNGTTYLLNGFGSVVSTVTPYDPTQDRINLATLWTVDNTGTSDTGFNIREVYVRPDNIRVQEALDSLKFAITGWCYGPISSVSAFDPGTDVSR